MRLPTGPGERVVELITAHLPPSVRVLNVGSGDGVLSEVLRQRGYTVIDIDIANSVTRADWPKPTLFDGHSIPLPDESVDAVLCVYVLHHAHTKQQALLREITRVTRDRLVVLEDTPVQRHEYVLLFLHMSLSYLRGWSRWCTFRTDPAWRSCFRNLGLAVLASGRVPGRMSFPVTHQYYVLCPNETEVEGIGHE